MDTDILIREIRARGVSIAVKGTDLNVIAQTEPDPDTLAMLEELATKKADAINLLIVESTDSPKSHGDLVDGDIKAVLIDSPIVGPVWFALNDNWKSGDEIPVFFASELPFLRGMDELRRRYEEKRALGGGWIRDRIEVPTRH